jgi:cobalamin biosynthesis protein CobW
VLPTRWGAVDPLVLLGLSAAAEETLDTRPSLHDGAAEHDHDDFESFALDLGEIDDPDALDTRLARAIVAHDILRLKGFVAVRDRPARRVVQAVGARIDSYYDRIWRAGEGRASRLVVIGRRGLDRAAIARAVAG